MSQMTVIYLLLILFTLPVFLLPFLHRKGWLNQDRGEKFVFAVISLMAVSLIVQAIRSHMLHELRFQPYGLIVCIVGMWLSVLAGRRNVQQYNPAHGAVLAGYIGISMLLLR
jgi:hypothetical protein